MTPRSTATRREERTLLRVAGTASLATWAPLFVINIPLLFSIVVFFAAINALVAGVGVVASVQALRGRPGALRVLVALAVAAIGLLVLPLRYVDHSAPETAAAWAAWSAAVILMTTTLLSAIALRLRRPAERSPDPGDDSGRPSRQVAPRLSSTHAFALPPCSLARCVVEHAGVRARQLDAPRPLGSCQPRLVERVGALARG